MRWRLWALVPIVLIVAVVSIFASAGGSLVDLVGHESAAGRRVRHPAGRVQAGRDPRPRAQPAAGRPHDRRRRDRRRHRPVRGRGLADARPARVARRSSFRSTGSRTTRTSIGVTSSSGIQTDLRGAGRGRDQGSDVRGGLPRLRAHRLPRRRRAGGARPCLAAVAAARERQVAGARSWPSPPGC